jgi:hypothetical protein
MPKFLCLLKLIMRKKWSVSQETAIWGNDGEIETLFRCLCVVTDTQHKSTLSSAGRVAEH